MSVYMYITLIHCLSYVHCPIACHHVESTGITYYLAIIILCTMYIDLSGVQFGPVFVIAVSS